MSLYSPHPPQSARAFFAENHEPASCRHGAAIGRVLTVRRGFTVFFSQIKTYSHPPWDCESQYQFIYNIGLAIRLSRAIHRAQEGSPASSIAPQAMPPPTGLIAHQPLDPRKMAPSGLTS
jgi:hypothetical protein